MLMLTIYFCFCIMKLKKFRQNRCDIMSRIFAVCGRICSGKTHYCARLTQKENAVVLSCDEIFYDIFHKDAGEKHDELAADVKRYLLKKADEIVRAGCNVVLDWGFWQRNEREEYRKRCRSAGTEVQWHYIDISDEDWLRNIDERNRSIEAGISPDYYIDEGLMKKAVALFEAPDRDEIDVWYSFTRDTD